MLPEPIGDKFKFVRLGCLDFKWYQSGCQVSAFRAASNSLLLGPTGMLSPVCCCTSGCGCKPIISRPKLRSD